MQCFQQKAVRRTLIAVDSKYQFLVRSEQARKITAINRPLFTDACVNFCPPAGKIAFKTHACIETGRPLCSQNIGGIQLEVIPIQCQAQPMPDSQ